MHYRGRRSLWNRRLAEARLKTALRREKMGFIFQSHNLIPFLSVLDNVIIAAELVGTPQEEAEQKDDGASGISGSF